MRTQAVLDGTWKSQSSWDGLKDGILHMAPYTNMPDDVKKMAEETQAKIESGELKPFTGPINTQDGTLWLKDGESADDGTLLGGQTAAALADENHDGVVGLLHRDRMTLPVILRNARGHDGVVGVVAGTEHHCKPRQDQGHAQPLVASVGITFCHWCQSSSQAQSVMKPKRVVSPLAGAAGPATP